MSKAKKAATKKAPAKKAIAKPDTVNLSERLSDDAPVFTDEHEHCKWLDKILSIVDGVGNIIEDVAQAWRHGKEIKAAK